MRVREPREGWVAFVWVWAAIFGGVPLAALRSGEAVDGPVPVLLLLPLIAVGVLVGVLRRSLRAGFTLAEDGIHGAHDSEDEVLPWSQVARLEWRWSGPTSDVKVNDEPLPSGPALHAVLHDGRAVRVMQRVARRRRQRRRIAATLASARSAGLLPVPFDADADVSAGLLDAIRRVGGSTPTVWGTGGEELPSAGWPVEPGSQDAIDGPDDPPAWPMA